MTGKKGGRKKLRRVREWEIETTLTYRRTKIRDAMRAANGNERDDEDGEAKGWEQIGEVAQDQTAPRVHGTRVESKDYLQDSLDGEESYRRSKKLLECPCQAVPAWPRHPHIFRDIHLVSS